MKDTSLADNGRFGVMAALAPQQRQCELGSYYPAGTLVKPPLRQAARYRLAADSTVRLGNERTERC